MQQVSSHQKDLCPTNLLPPYHHRHLHPHPRPHPHPHPCNNHHFYHIPTACPPPPFPAWLQHHMDNPDAVAKALTTHPLLQMVSQYRLHLLTKNLCGNYPFLTYAFYVCACVRVCVCVCVCVCVGCVSVRIVDE